MLVRASGKVGRTTTFAPRLQRLLDDHLGQDLFRIDHNTVGVADPGLMHAILNARLATETERPTFKPLHGRSIPRADALSAMQAIGRDVRTALKRAAPTPGSFAGQWPHVGHVFLRNLLLAHDPHRLRFLMNRVLELTPKLTWAFIMAGAVRGFSLRSDASEMARLTAKPTSYHDRRYAMGLYRRTAAPICFTISTLVANALWLGAPFDDHTPNRHVILEALRLLPPSWNILRRASPEFPALDSRIGPEDDVLILPLLSQRDPSLWTEADAYRPERWSDADLDTHPAYLPFGHKSERCWGLHMVLPLAEMLLDMLRTQHLAPDPVQTHAEVRLAGLLGVTEVKVR